MRKKWKLYGAYFRCEMIVRVMPAVGSPHPIDEHELERLVERMEPVGKHFTDMGQLHELSLRREIEG
jgi:hypothetical protein